MANVDTEARLDLIQIAASVVSCENEIENEELADLIERLCRRRELPVAESVSSEDVAMLRELAHSDLRAWTTKHGITFAGPSAD